MIKKEKLSLQEKCRNLSNVPKRLWGLWQRSFFKWEDEDVDRTTTVLYLQTPRLFADLRIPATRSKFTHSDGLQDLTTNELLMLAEQIGFAGYTTIKDSLIFWNHIFDYQPSGSIEGDIDVGQVRFRGKVMQELGVKFDYTEYWRHLDDGNGRFISLWSAKQALNPESLLVVGGDHFIYTCDRAVSMPPVKNFIDFLKSASDPVCYLTSEFSYGRRKGGTKPWEIIHSTVPSREGSSCFQIGELIFDNNKNVIERSAETRLDSPIRAWEIIDNTLTESKIDKFLNPTF